MVIESTPLLSFDSAIWGKFTFFKQHFGSKTAWARFTFNKRRWQAAHVFLNVRLIADVRYWAESVPNQAAQIAIQLGQSILFQTWLGDLENWRGLLLCETGKDMRLKVNTNSEMTLRKKSTTVFWMMILIVEQTSVTILYLYICRYTIDKSKYILFDTF